MSILHYAFPALSLSFLFMVSADLQNTSNASPSPASIQPPSILDKSTKAGDADALWTKIEIQIGDINPREQSDEVISQLKLVLSSLKEFVAKYPQNIFYWRARLNIVEYSHELATVSNTIVNQEEENQELQTIASGQNILGDVAAEADLALLKQKISRLLHTNASTDVDWDDSEKMISDYEANYRDTQIGKVMVGRLWEAELTALENADKGNLYNALLKQIKSDSTPEVQDVANAALKLENLKSKPLDLKFIALDGTPVDISKLREHVVLIHFWATWCGTCVEEMPNVIAAYNKFHDKGFDVIGISLDQDKNKLLDFTKDHGIVWPQYFDGKGWENAISKPLGIDGLPCMWLIDKDGFIFNTDGREDLDVKVEKLLNLKAATATPAQVP